MYVLIIFESHSITENNYTRWKKRAIDINFKVNAKRGQILTFIIISDFEIQICGSCVFASGIRNQVESASNWNMEIFKKKYLGTLFL